jgi:WD40 repeat protein
MSGATGTLRSTPVAPDSTPLASTDQAIAFISYAREDQDFVFRLSEALQIKNVRVRGDWQLIRGENYDSQLHEMQLGADVVVFVVSQESVRSAPCKAELDRASEHKKRLIPVVHRDPGPVQSEMHPALALPQWTFLRDGDDFVAGVNGLVDAINTDFDLMPEHRRLLQAAEIWERHTRSGSYLLRKDGLKRAEAWLAETSRRPNKLPNATPLQLDYIQASRQARTRGNRVALAVTSIIAAMMAILAVIAFTQRNTAVSERGIANKQRDEAKKQTGIAQEQKEYADEERTKADQRRVEAEQATKAERAAREESDRQRILGIWQSATRQAVRDAADHTDDDRSALLSRQAMLFHRLTPDQPRYLVEDALQTTSYLNVFSHVLGKHGDTVRSMAFSPDGTHLASASNDGIRLWDLSQPQSAPQLLSGHECAAPSLFSPDSVTFSPDGDRLVSAGLGHVCFWNLSHLQATPEVLLHNPVGINLEALSPDSNHLVLVNQDKTLRIWDLRQPERASQVLSGRHDDFSRVHFSMDGNRLASACRNGSICLWDLRQPQADPEVLPSPQGRVLFAVFSPNGDLLAAAGDDHTVRIWNLREPGADLKVLPAPLVYSITFSPNSDLLAVAGDDRTVRIWNLRQPEAAPRVLSGPRVSSITFSPEGNRLASADHDGTVRIWDLRPAVVPQVLSRGQAAVPSIGSHQTPVLCVASSPDGNRLASGSLDGILLLWDLRNPQAAPQTLLGHKNAINSVSFSPDGNHLASAGEDGRVRIWDLRQPQPVGVVLPGVLSDPRQQAVWSVSFSPDGNRLASGGDDQTVRLWDLRRLQKVPQVLRGHQAAVRSVAFSPVGNRLASASFDGAIRLWDLRQPHPASQLLPGHQNAVYSVAFSPDGKQLASASFDRTVRLWDLGQPEVPKVLGHQGFVLSVAFSPDGNRLASAGDERTVRIWDLRQTQAAPQLLSGHQGRVSSVAFSPDGNRVGSAGEDGTIRIWPLWSRAADYLCTRVWRNLSMDEWRFYIGEGIPYERTCPNLPPGAGVPK